MTEEEYFRKTYPDSCYGDKPLSPYWDFFQDGVEFGERQSEKKIEELERKLEQTEKDLADYQFNYPTIKELETENNKLLDVINGQDVKIADLESENAELKKENLENESEAREINIRFDELLKKYILQKDQLTNAKELLKWWVNHCGYYDLYYAKKTEQFLKEIEK